MVTLPSGSRAARDISELAGAIEAMLFIAGDPVARDDLAMALEIGMLELEAALEYLEHAAEDQRRGVTVVTFGDKVQLLTRRDYKPYIDRLFEPTRKPPLSQSAIETLSIIAYKQPITRAEVEEIRGVKCDYAIQSLIKKNLVREIGRKEALGRPVLWGTTDVFLRHLGLQSLSELPALSDAEIDLSDLAEAQHKTMEDASEGPAIPAISEL